MMVTMTATTPKHTEPRRLPAIHAAVRAAAEPVGRWPAVVTLHGAPRAWWLELEWNREDRAWYWLYHKRGLYRMPPQHDIRL